MKKVFIIGSGPSGLSAAIKAADNYDVTVFEKNNKIGKKLLLTGNGKCNYYNENQNIDKYHTNSKNVDLSKLINNEYLVKVQTFFEKIGLVPNIKDGYYYPSSNQSISVVNALHKECMNKDVKFIYEEVIDVEKSNNRFIVKTSNNEYLCDILILSTGGLAAPKTGSTGFGIDIAKKFEHNIIKPVPALTKLITDENLKNISGVRFNGLVKSLDENNNVIEEEIGEVQLTDYGLSGIPIMQLSSIISRRLVQGKKTRVEVNFLPQISDDILSLRSFLKVQNKHVENRTISEILDQLLNYNLTNFILNKSDIKSSDYIDKLSNEKLDNLCSNLISYKFNIKEVKGFDDSQTTSGGVDLNDVNLDTLESKKIKNLYFTGELLDIDAKCGGYNLTYSWITGLIAGEVKGDK